MSPPETGSHVSLAAYESESPACIQFPQKKRRQPNNDVMTFLKTMLHFPIQKLHHGFRILIIIRANSQKRTLIVSVALSPFRDTHFLVRKTNFATTLGRYNLSLKFSLKNSL